VVGRVVRSGLLLILMVLGADALGAVKVRVDRNPVRITESFRLVFEVGDEVLASPDFSALNQDFEVLGTSQGTSVNVVNGRMQRSTSWTHNMMPRREGALMIPPIQFDGEISRPVTITVIGAAADQTETGAREVMLEAEVDNSSPYVQQQTVVTIRLYRAVSMSEASLTEPTLTGVEAVLERLGDDIGYETERGGLRYGVVERKYAIFPQRSGAITIQPLRFDGRVGTDRGFFAGPFESGRMVRVRSAPIELKVQPIPPAFPGRVWLPAGRINLIESWPGDTSTFRVGEPVTRTLTLSGVGLIASQLPEIGALVPDGIKQYPDQPVLETRPSGGVIVASRQEKIAMIPSRPGRFVLPEIEVPWWNTKFDRLEYARLPERVIDVLPATGLPVPPPVSSDIRTDSGPENASKIDLLGPVADVKLSASVWAWVSVGLGLGWLITLSAWWWSRRRIRAPPTPDRSRRADIRSATRALEQACSKNDPTAAQRALLQWAECRWPGNPFHSLGDLGAKLEDEMQTEIHHLNRALYSPTSDNWSGASLSQAFSAVDRNAERNKPAVKPDLEPLYRT
jgi:hypothetical protein